MGKNTNIYANFQINFTIYLYMNVPIYIQICARSEIALWQAVFCGGGGGTTQKMGWTGPYVCVRLP